MININSCIERQGVASLSCIAVQDDFYTTFSPARHSMLIYKTTNLINGKIYIGQDSKNNPEYLGSGKILKNAFKKYGKENFKKEILEYCDSIERLNEREIYLIKIYDTRNPKIGYNILSGGHGFGSGKDNHNFGKHPSEETRKLMSMKSKGRKPTKESREKMSRTRIERGIAKGNKNGMFNNHMFVGKGSPLFGKRGKEVFAFGKHWKWQKESIERKEIYFYVLYNSTEEKFYTTTNLKQFCRDNNLCNGNMTSVCGN